MTRLMAAFLLAAACAGPASAKQEGPDAVSLEGAFAEASGAARSTVEGMAARRTIPPEGQKLYRALWLVADAVESCRSVAPIPGEPLADCVDSALLSLRQASSMAVRQARENPGVYGPAEGFELVNQAASLFHCVKNDRRTYYEPAYPGVCVASYVRTLRAVFPPAAYQELTRRVSAAAAPDETGLIDIPVRAVGGGTSMTFTKGQCLFCTRYREQAETMAMERAKANAEAVCERKRGFLPREPEAEATDCARVDGWVSYYLCGARAWGVCRAPLPR